MGRTSFSLSMCKPSIESSSAGAQGSDAHVTEIVATDHVFPDGRAKPLANKGEL